MYRRWREAALSTNERFSRHVRRRNFVGARQSPIMAGMTIVEKIFARNSGEEHVKPGDFVVVDVDVAVMLDMSFLATERRNILKVHDPEKIAVIFDHMARAADRRAAEAHV